MADFSLEMKHITKDFSGVRALDDVSIKVRKGEIHALCGENGAGKSTLMKVLSGVYDYNSFSGEIDINGQMVKFRNTKDSEAKGIAIIHQELNLVPEFSIVENIFLGRELSKFGLLSSESMFAESMRLLDLVGLHISPDRKVKFLGIGEQQLVEIAKALKNKASILILDEPTAALTEREVKLLLNILKQLREQGVTCIYISHKLKEVLEISDTVTVLRDGKVIDTNPTRDLEEKQIVARMVGRDLSDFFPRVEVESKKTVLEVQNWSVINTHSGKAIVDNVSLSVCSGEIVGIAGLVGAGRTEFVTSLFGAYPGKVTGDLKLFGQSIQVRTPEEAIKHGIALVTEDRKRFGLILDMDVRKNISLTALSLGNGLKQINQLKEVLSAQKMIKELRVKTPSLEVAVRKLSGGNQQKVVIAKWLLNSPKILILDEPTRGIDVGAKYEIYQLMNELTQQGMAVIMVSSELPEILGMSDRVIVMAGGRFLGEFRRKDATEEKVMQLATGGQSS